LSSGGEILQDMATSGGEPQDLMETQLGKVREHLNNDLFAFAWTVMGFQDLEPELHGEVCHLLGLWGQPGYKRLMIQVPRGSYKTSLCTISNSLWQICRSPNDTIVIFNERQENSKKWLRAIREVMMTSKLFHMVYRLPPGIAFDDNRSLPRWWKWNDEEVVINRPRAGIPEASLTAMGVGTASTGGHWSRIIKDDLISEEAKNSESVMARTKEWFDSSLPLENPPYKGNDLVVCTPWTYGDVYRMVLEKYEYKLYRRSALEEDAEGNLRSVMPSKWTVNELLKEQERDPYYFSAQMQCQPRAGREVSFNPEWLRWGHVVEHEGEPAFFIHNEHYDPTISEVPDDEGSQVVPLWWCQKALLVDPAAADSDTKKRDYTARTGMVLVAIDPWGRKFVLDCWAGRRDPTDEILWMLEISGKWGTNKIAVEEVTFSNMYRHFLIKEAAKQNRALSFVSLKPGMRDKETRIQGKIPEFRAGLFYLNEIPALKKLQQEYIEFPYGRTRDLLDALAYDAEALRRPESPVEYERRIDEDRVSRIMGGRDPVTGY
jgi:hypothetical protein